MLITVLLTLVGLPILVMLIATIMPLALWWHDTLEEWLGRR
jgi:hypothetical protein